MQREIAYVRPGDNIVCNLLKSTKYWVFENLGGEIKAISVFYKGEARLATTGVTTESDIGFKVRNLPGVGF